VKKNIFELSQKAMNLRRPWYDTGTEKCCEFETLNIGKSVRQIQ
jgi:hypothetical protein